MEKAIKLANRNFRVASGYFLLRSIVMRDSVHTGRDQLSTNGSNYTDKTP